MLNSCVVRTTTPVFVAGILAIVGCGETSSPSHVEAEPARNVAAPEPTKGKGKTRSLARPTDHPLARMDPEERREYYRKKNEEAAAKQASP